MAAVGPQRIAIISDESTQLFDRIGAFLAEQGLSPDPLHYAFAYRVLTDMDGPLADAVQMRTDGGVRLSRRDIEDLGGSIGALSTPPTSPDDAARARSDGLVAQTQMQVEGFTDLVCAIRDDTAVFGRDLAASADAIRDASDILAVDEVVRITSSMLDRVHSAETRLEAATHEASDLRAKLEEARDNARRDPLTDLPNRRAFEEAYAEECARGTTLCVAVCDVDHFKLVNDRFGHAVGDRVLKAIGDALSQACPGHLVARYGGEEFAILFKGLDSYSATALLNDARQTVASKRYRLRGSDESLGAVTFSAGLTPALDCEDLCTAFGRADMLLYAAKNAGRNLLRAG